MGEQSWDMNMGNKALTVGAAVVTCRRGLADHAHAGTQHGVHDEEHSAWQGAVRAYVKNSIEAAETYCKAFGAEITREFKNEDNTAYEHCELSVNGEGFLALAEARNPFDIEIVHKNKWETMTFNVFEMGTEKAVDNEFQVLSEGGVVLEPIHALPWSRYCETVIDKYGVCWWLSI